MNTLEDLKYTKNDEWIKIEGDKAKVGLTDYAQDQLSDIVYVDLMLAEGDEFAKGDTIATVESVKAAADIYGPISGTVTAVNEVLDPEPEKVNEDPFGEAWLYEFEIKDASEAGELLDADAYKAYCEERSN